jgi:hypothetical protein
MADVAFGGVGKIFEIALKIKEAVKTVKQNQKECQDIQRCVARVSALLKRFDEVTTETMKDEVMRGTLEDLAETIQGALDLVTKCQRKHVVRRFIGAGDMAKELRQVQDDIVRKLTIGTFATNVLQLSITMTTIFQVPCHAAAYPTKLIKILTSYEINHKNSQKKIESLIHLIFIYVITIASLSSLKLPTYNVMEIIPRNF